MHLPEPGGMTINAGDDSLRWHKPGNLAYAMGSLAAAALAAVLYAVINAGAVVDAIESIITDALSNTPV